METLLKPKFKVGDKVRLIGDKHEGVIVEVNTSAVISYTIYIKEINKALTFNEVLLEKVDKDGTRSN